MGAHSSLYKTKEWFRLRHAQLQSEPLCWMCAQMGRTAAAVVVDHKRRHNGDRALFFDSSNLASLCKHCHDSHKQRQEVTGVLRGNDHAGLPLDPNHHWNR